MEIVTTGKVVVPARVENLADLYEAQKGAGPQDEVRAVEVCDALYEAVRLTVQGRDCVIEVSEIPDACPVLIGNPDHGGEQMIDLF